MASQIRIGAKTLGSLALPSFCPRCFWVQMRVQGKLPYQIFPGIFSSIDSYGKKLVQGWFDRHGGPPPWLAALGDIKGYRPSPHHSQFNVLDGATSVLLTGTPDGVLIRSDDSHVIVDYKTARFTQQQDALLPMYDVQLNAYAYIGERCGLAPVSGLALIYTEPVTDTATANNDANTTGQGFIMQFRGHILPVQLSPERIPSLLERVRKICDLPRAPDPSAGCTDCGLLDNLLKAASE
jgi:hypothetical protein